MVELRWICEDRMMNDASWWVRVSVTRIRFQPAAFGRLYCLPAPCFNSNEGTLLCRNALETWMPLMPASCSCSWMQNVIFFFFLWFGCNFFDVCTVFDKQTACHNLEQVHNLPQGISLKTGEKYRKSWWEIMHVEQHAFTPNLHLPLSSDPTRHRVQWACSHFCRSTVSLRGTMATRGRQESRVGPCGPGAARAGNAERKDRCLVVIVRRRLGTNCLFW